MDVLRFIAIAVFLLLAATNAWAEESANGRQRLQKFLDGLTTLTAQFEQQLFDEYGELIETSAGRVAISRPGKFRWEYRSPYNQLIVTDAQTLWVYDADLEQLTVNPFADTATGSPAELLVGEMDIDRHYSLVEHRDDDGMIWISLTPRKQETQYNAIDIGFDDDGFKAMRLKDNLNQLTVIHFAATLRNIDISADEFSFTPPVGVDVMRGTGN